MYSAKILADSINLQGDRLTTFEITYPRFVHSELLTHRMLSRNSASSRAIPISLMIARVATYPVIPVWWGKAQPGMQAKEEIEDKTLAERDWLIARDFALESAQMLHKRGLHKQIVNRLLEPWMWITVIVSATDWWHFFNLRNHPDAQPEIAKIAGMMVELYDHNQPAVKKSGEWHLPLWFAEDEELRKDEFTTASFKAYVSAGRCARVSYLTHDGKRDLQEDYALASKLESHKPMHASPLEHPAKALATSQRIGNYTGWLQLRKMNMAEYSNYDMRENNA